jgi:hypothetical protein
MSLFNHPLWRATRRNHAVEHATVHLLARQLPGRVLAGHSNPRGFLLLAEADLAQVQEAVEEAIARLKAGQKHLAIHPGCGTNLVINLLALGSAAWVGMGHTRNDRERIDRIPVSGLLAAVLLALVQPLGPWLQAHITTEAEIGDLRIQSIRLLRERPPRLYFIKTQSR